MGRKRRFFSAKEKSKIALEAIRERYTASEIAQKYDVHPSQVNKWKREALSNFEDSFSKQRSEITKISNQEELINRLYRHIGELKVELDWVKKKSTQ